MCKFKGYKFDKSNALLSFGPREGESDYAGESRQNCISVDAQSKSLEREKPTDRRTDESTMPLTTMRPHALFALTSRMRNCVMSVFRF